MKKALTTTEPATRPAERPLAAARPWLLWLALGGVAVGALLLRVWTIRQVLPFVDHPDEPNPINYVIQMIESGDPNQQFFQKPSLYIYTLLAALQAHYAWGRATGLYGDLSQMVVTTHTITTVPGFFITARLVTALFGVLTTLSAYALGVRGWGRGAGLVGALFVALLPIHLRFSQWATTDVMATFLASLSLGVALVVLRTGRWQAYMVAGAFAGLAASAKYNAGAVVGAIIVAAIVRVMCPPLRSSTLEQGFSQPPGGSSVVPETIARGGEEAKRRGLMAIASSHPRVTNGTAEDKRPTSITRRKSLLGFDDRPQTTDDRRKPAPPSSVVGRRSSEAGKALRPSRLTPYALRLKQLSGELMSSLAAESAKLALAGLAALVCFAAGTPYAVLRWEQVGGGIARQWSNYGGANGHYRGAWNVAGYVDFFLGDGLGLLGCLLVAAGLAILAWRRPAVLAVWLGFALPSLLIHLSRPTHFMQNMLPLLVACALPVGVAVTELPALAARRAPALRQVVLVALLAAMALPPLGRSLAYVGRQAAGDSRLELLSWIEATVPPGARIAAELKPVPGPTEARWTDVPSLAAHDLAWYRAQGYAYLVGSSKRWNGLQPPASYAPLLGGVVAEFGPRQSSEEMTGSHLLVINTGLTAADVPLPLAGDVRVGGARLLGVAVGDPSADGDPPMLVPTMALKPGGVLGLRTFWQVEAPFSQDYLIFVHLLDANGGRPTQRDAAPWQGRFPTTTWRQGTLVVDANDVYLPPTIAPGEYRIMVGMYDPASDTRASITAAGTPLPDGMVEVARVTVGP